MANDGVARVVELTPDESITDAIGRGHTLMTAVADIIDNSLDAKAENIRIRFLVDDDRVVAVRIRDDGIGMTPPVLQDAMTLGKQQTRSVAALGHFGIGLKAASLSQALTLTVYSRNYFGDPCAMRIRRGSFNGEVLNGSAAESGYEWDARGPASTGTVVEWQNLEGVNQSQLATERRSWLERTIASLLQTLGLTFHRIIQDRGIRITIDTWDVRVGAPGLPRKVEPRDPFQFHLSGQAGYPTSIAATMSDGARLEAECFILPPRSDSPSAWLLGRNPVEWQGLYVYRHDRLLQAGGWLDVRQDDRRLRLARMRINVTEQLERHLRLRHEKSGVTATPEFIAALERATNERGVTLDLFRNDAAELYRASNVRKQTVKPAVPVKSGLPDRVIEAVRDEVGERDDDPIRIEWAMLSEGQLYDLQHDRRLLRFNLGYRAALGGEGAAIVPTLVYLLLENNFSKSRLNQVTRDQIDAWQAIASAAMLAQMGDDSYDALANWPARPASAAAQRPVIMAGPRPTPPSVELRWAHLGQRGQVALQTESGGEHVPAAKELTGPSHSLITPTPTQFETTAIAIHSDIPAGVEPEELELGVDEGDGQKIKGAETIVRSLTPLTNVLPGDREIVVMYRSRADIDTIAATLEVDARDVAMRLSAVILQLDGDDIDDQETAALHGMPYSPDERERILNLYREGRTIQWIASHYGRTQFAIAWLLLSSPKRPVEVPKGLVKRIDRALATAPASDAAKQL